MTNYSGRPPSWQHRVTQSRPRRRHGVAFSSGHITVGAIHMAGMIVGILAADRMQSPGARWSAIAGFGIASGIGEAIWREHIERERDEQEGMDRD
ncbi:MAG: hypothetical protein ABL967_01470 [Bryobacteraceae bacterium]